MNSKQLQVKQVKPLNECYFIVDRKTYQIIEFNTTANSKLHETLYLSNDELHPPEIFYQIIEKILKEQPININISSTVEIEFNNDTTIEVRIYPTTKTFIVFLKEVVNIEELNKALMASNLQLMSEKERADEAKNAKIKFLLQMSHELRTPLNCIMGYNQLLLTEPDSYLSKEKYYQLEKILKASKQLKKMINDMLNFARYDNVNLPLYVKKIEINKLIEDCIVEATYYTNNNNVSIEFADLTKHFGLEIYSDPERLKQVVINLLINAIKYNKNNGNVRIETKVINDLLNIEFHDTGRGIAEKELEDIFNLFYRSPSNDPTIEGSGIGLSLSNQIIHDLGGTITVNSVIDVGSTFKITLPLSLN